MELDDVLLLIEQKLGTLLAGRFTGQAVFTFHCREGGIGRASLQVNQDFSKKDLQSSMKTDKLLSDGHE